MEFMTVLQIIFIVLLCAPVMYLTVFFVRKLNMQQAQNVRQRQQMRKQNEQRFIYNNGRSGRRR